MWAQHPPEEGTPIAATKSGGGRIAGIVAMVISSLLFALMGALIRLASDVDPLWTSLFRFAVGAVLVATLAMTGVVRLSFVDGKLLVVRGLLGGASVYLYFLSIVRIGVARGSVISNAYPVFAAAVGALLLKERVKPTGWIALIAAVAGLVLMRWGGRTDGVEVGSPAHLSLWYGLALLGALLGGLAIVAVRKLAETDSAHSIFLAQSAVGFWMVLLPAASRPAPFSLSVGLLLLGVGFVAAGAQLAMTWSYARVDIATGSLLGMLTPLASVAIGLFAFQESIGGIELAGAALVLGSCALALAPAPRSVAVLVKRGPSSYIHRR